MKKLALLGELLAAVGCAIALLAGCGAERQQGIDTPAFRLQAPGTVQQIAITPDGEYLVAACPAPPPPLYKSVRMSRPARPADRLTGTLVMWRLVDTTLVRSLALTDYDVGSIAISPAGEYLAAVHQGYRTDSTANCAIGLWHVSDGVLVRMFAGHTWGVTALAFTPDGSWVVSADHYGELKLWDRETGKLLQVVRSGAYLVDASDRDCLVISPKDGHLICLSGNGGVRIVRLSDWAVLRSLEAAGTDLTLRVAKIAGTPDGEHVIGGGSAGGEAVLAVWRYDTGELVHILKGHADVVMAVAAAPDGRHAVSSSADGTIRLWSLEAGTLARTIRVGTNRVTSVLVTSDGRYIVSADGDNSIEFWSLEPSARTRRVL